MYEKFCDSFYLAQGAGRKFNMVTILSCPTLAPKFDLKEYPVVNKNNCDYIIDNFGGYVKVEDLSKYNISYQ